MCKRGLALWFVLKRVALAAVAGMSLVAGAVLLDGVVGAGLAAVCPAPWAGPPLWDWLFLRAPLNPAMSDVARRFLHFLAAAGVVRFVCSAFLAAPSGWRRRAGCACLCLAAMTWAALGLVCTYRVAQAALPVLLARFGRDYLVFCVFCVGLLVCAAWRYMLVPALFTAFSVFRWAGGLGAVGGPVLGLFCAGWLVAASLLGVEDYGAWIHVVSLGMVPLSGTPRRESRVRGRVLRDGAGRFVDAVGPVGVAAAVVVFNICWLGELLRFLIFAGLLPLGRLQGLVAQLGLRPFAYCLGAGVLAVGIVGGVFLAAARRWEELRAEVPGVRNPTARERTFLEPVWREVCGRARLRPGLYVVDRPDVNACAWMEKNLVVVTTGLLRQPRAEVAGVLAHEAGHLVPAHRVLDTVVFGAVNAVYLIMVFGSYILAFLDVAARGKLADPFAVLGAYLLIGIGGGLVIFLPLRLVYHAFADLVFEAVRSWYGRLREHAADRYAARWGYGPGLVAFFGGGQGDEEGGPKGVWETLRRTHPSVSGRVDRLREFVFPGPLRKPGSTTP